MASEANPVQIPAVSLVHGRQAPTQVTVDLPSGKSPPPGGNVAAGAARSTPPPSGVSRTNDVQAQVAFLNKFLNDSGKPAQFRADPNDSSLIQEVNPANGYVIANYPVSDFPALAKSLGISSALINERA